MYKHRIKLKGQSKWIESKVEVSDEMKVVEMSVKVQVINWDGDVGWSGNPEKNLCSV